MKRKTQLEKAIEQLDSEMVALQRDHDLKVSGIRAAIGVLREQKTRAPKRRLVMSAAGGPVGATSATSRADDSQ